MFIIIIIHRFRIFRYSRTVNSKMTHRQSSGVSRSGTWLSGCKPPAFLADHIYRHGWWSRTPSPCSQFCTTGDRQSHPIIMMIAIKITVIIMTMITIMISLMITTTKTITTTFIIILIITARLESIANWLMNDAIIRMEFSPRRSKTDTALLV